MPQSHNVPSRLQWFMGKKNHSRISRLPHPSTNIVSAPYSLYIVASSLSLPSTPPLFCSLSGSCLGPLGLSSYQLVMGPGGSGPRPWTQTGWLAGFISLLRTPCSLPSSACCFSQTEKNVSRYMRIHKHCKTTFQKGNMVTLDILSFEIKYSWK